MGDLFAEHDQWDAGRFVSETARLIGRQPDLSDAAPRWGGVTTCRWTHPAHESTVPAMNAHFLAYHFGPRAQVSFRLNGGRADATWCDPGACTYLPANLPVNWNLLTGMNVINILIPDTLVNEAREHARNEGVRLSVQSPTVGFYSRGLERLSVLFVRALLRNSGEPGHLQAEHLAQNLCLEILKPTRKPPSLLNGMAQLTPAQTRRSIDLMHASLSESAAGRGTKRKWNSADLAASGESVLRLSQVQCDLQSLSAAAGVSTFHFARAFRNTVGTSPHRYLSRLRTSKAQALLIKSSLPMAEIGETIGFHSAASFTNFFRRWIGVSPTAYRDAFAAPRAVTVPLRLAASSPRPGPGIPPLKSSHNQLA